MSARQRLWNKDGRQQKAWCVDFVFKFADGKKARIREFSPVNTRVGAEQHERDLRTSLQQSGKRERAAPAQTFAQFSEQFREWDAANNKPSTRRANRQILDKHLLPFFGTRMLAAIRPSQIEAFKSAQLKAGLSAKTVNNHLSTLSGVLRRAVEFDALAAMPSIDWLKTPDTAIDFLTIEESAKLVAHAEAGRWQTMVVLSLNTGLRIGELCGLSWDCVQWSNSTLVVRQNVYRGQIGTPKGGRTREIPLNADALGALRNLPRRLDVPWVFPQKDGNYIRNPQHTAAEAIRRQAKRAGLRPIGWHTLRHTFASHLVMAGVPIRAVQELLGHESLEMTLRYSHLAPSTKQDAVRVLETRSYRPLPGGSVPAWHIRGTWTAENTAGNKKASKPEGLEAV